MWQFNWGVFWAILAALSVRATWLAIGDMMVGDYAVSLKKQLSQMNQNLILIAEKLK